MLSVTCTPPRTPPFAYARLRTTTSASSPAAMKYALGATVKNNDAGVTCVRAWTDTVLPASSRPSTST